MLIVLRHTVEGIPKINVSSPLRFTDGTQRIIGLYLLFQITPGTGQNTLHINLGGRRLLSNAFHNNAGIRGHMCRIVNASRTQIVCTNHEKDFAGFSGYHRLKIGHHLIAYRSGNSAIDNSRITKSLPPLMHIGDTVADEHNVIGI